MPEAESNKVKTGRKGELYVIEDKLDEYLHDIMGRRNPEVILDVEIIRSIMVSLIYKVDDKDLYKKLAIEEGGLSKRHKFDVSWIRDFCKRKCYTTEETKRCLRQKPSPCVEFPMDWQAWKNDRDKRIQAKKIEDEKKNEKMIVPGCDDLLSKSSHAALCKKRNTFEDASEITSVSPATVTCGSPAQISCFKPQLILAWSDEEEGSLVAEALKELEKNDGTTSVAILEDVVVDDIVPLSKDQLVDRRILRKQKRTELAQIRNKSALKRNGKDGGNDVLDSTHNIIVMPQEVRMNETEIDDNLVELVDHIGEIVTGSTAEFGNLVEFGSLVELSINVLPSAAPFECKCYL